MCENYHFIFFSYLTMLFLAEDATHSRPTRSHELQAVILAGFGNRQVT
jgi:hypothetical protein